MGLDWGFDSVSSYENDNPVDELVTVHAPIALVKDKSDLGNDATQSDSAKLVNAGCGTKQSSLINFDGMNDVWSLMKSILFIPF